MIDTESDPGSWADAIEHSPCLRVEEFEPGDGPGEQAKANRLAEIGLQEAKLMRKLARLQKDH